MRNASIINKRIMEIPNSGCFVDPLKTDRDKHAGVYRLIPNKPIETVVSQSFVGVGPQQMIPQNTTGANARPATRKAYGMDNSIEESITMKNTIKLNEQQLRQIVAESVKKVLKESCWYGDVKPFETIIQAANEIVGHFDYTQADDYDDMGDCDGPDITPQVYKWAKEVAESAEYWLRCNSRYTPINGGEDW